MNTRAESPHPSQAELLQCEFAGEWDIWRELVPTGRHGDWIAERVPGDTAEPTRLRAASVRELAELLREVSGGEQ
ncbi:hypothetical protein [Actinomadura roseirufa]|uniref:hypothetical protein n=1 Tax=Actinomadura roseirufa TaxID=2094049 RepID=UPI0010418897|nr:hypothetical protein [Actinomadura roseirufa]